MRSFFIAYSFIYPDSSSFENMNQICFSFSRFINAFLTSLSGEVPGKLPASSFTVKMPIIAMSLAFVSDRLLY